MAPKRARGEKDKTARVPANSQPIERRVTRSSGKRIQELELPPTKRTKPKKKSEAIEEEVVEGVGASDKGVSVDPIARAGRKRNKKEEEEEGEVVEDGVNPASAKTIVIEHCKQCSSFRKRAEMVLDGLKKRVPHLIVNINPDKPRRGCFEVRDEDGHTFVSLLDMPRPFTKMKALDLEKLVEEIVSYYTEDEKQSL